MGKIIAVGGLILFLLIILLPIIFGYYYIDFRSAISILISAIPPIVGFLFYNQGRKLVQQGVALDQPVEFQGLSAILPEPLQIKTKTCTSCGAKIPLDAQFCTQCRSKQDKAFITLATALPEADAKNVEMLLNLGIKTLEDLAGEDAAELCTILDVPIQIVRSWIDLARVKINA